MKEKKKLMRRIFVFTAIFVVMLIIFVFSTFAHSLENWAKAYKKANVSSTYSLIMNYQYHPNGRSARYYFANSNTQTNFATAMSGGFSLWDGMIGGVDCGLAGSTAHIRVYYNPYDQPTDTKAEALCYPGDGHLTQGNNSSEIIFYKLSFNDTAQGKKETAAHELGHLWGIDDLYNKGFNNLDSIYSTKTGSPTRHDKNAMFIGINIPWFATADGKVKYQKSVNSSGVVTWANNETITINGKSCTFNTSGNLTNGNTVTYNANGGGSPPASQDKVPGFNLRLTSLKPSTPKSYTVTFNPNGGNALTNPQRVLNCTFNTWNVNTSGTGAYYASGGLYSTDANATLYAKWNNPTIPSSIYNAFNPVRSGYTFAGWGTYANSGVDITCGVTPITASRTLYAQWQPNIYTISFNANGGINAPPNQIKTHDVPLTIINIYQPSYLNYQFLGWSTNPNATTPQYYPESKFYTNANTILYAVWDIPPYVEPQYTVSYNGNGSNVTNVPPSHSMDYGYSVTLSGTIPVRSGYIFSGWSANGSSGTATHQPGSSYEGNTNVTMYAIWAPLVSIPSNTPVTAYLAPGENHWYEFTPSTSGVYTFTSASAIDTYGQLCCEDSQLTYNDDGGTNNNFLISYNLYAGTTYRLKVRGCYTSTSGNYTVGVYPGAAPTLDTVNAWIKNIQPTTQIADFKVKTQLMASTANAEVLVYRSGTLLTSGYIATGDVVQVKNGSTVISTYTVLIRGDINGDGDVNIFDKMMINDYIFGKITLSGIYFTAADVTRDGAVNTFDNTMINNHIFGTIVIDQS